MHDEWEREALSELRGAVYRGDGSAVVDALQSGPLDAVLQLGGDGLLAALEARTEGARGLAVTCAGLLRARAANGDAELADELDGALGAGEPSDLQPLAVDLDVLSSCLEGDPLRGGGRIDLRNGEVWPAPVYADSWSEAEDEDPDADHWLYFDCEGSYAGYRDMELFIEQVEDPTAAHRLAAAIRGRGAFRRFGDALHRLGGPLIDPWEAFSEDRRRGRARSWLASVGYRPTARAVHPASNDLSGM